MRSSNYSELEPRPDECVDTFLDGRLKLIQFRRGYRFSIDAVLLAQFVSIKRNDVVVDLGTGCGIIPMVLLLTEPVGHVFALEIQPELAEQAARNARLNGFEHDVDVILGDLKHPPLAPSSADVVICNPPYRPKNSGRINPDPQRAIARHEVLSSLNDILDAAAKMLRAKGRFAIIYPTSRLADLFIKMRGFNLEPKRLRIFYPSMRSDAKLALIEASLGGQAGLKISPPLLDQGDFSITK
jgi:tRNA1(Val) A37 N6-methylase TrmN6